MIEVDELDDRTVRPGPTSVAHQPARTSIVLVAIVAIALATATVVAVRSGDDERPTAPVTTARTTVTPAPGPVIDTATFPDELRSLDLLLYGGDDGPARLDLASGAVRRHTGGDRYQRGRATTTSGPQRSTARTTERR